MIIATLRYEYLKMEQDEADKLGDVAGGKNLVVAVEIKIRACKTEDDIDPKDDKVEEDDDEEEEEDGPDWDKMVNQAAGYSFNYCLRLSTPHVSEYLHSF